MFSCLQLFTVYKEKTGWTCLCGYKSSLLGPDLKPKAFKMFNMYTHYLSSKHWDFLKKTEDATQMNKHLKTATDLHVNEEDLASTIRDDAIITALRSKMSIKAVPTILNVTTRALMSIRNSSPIPKEELFQAAKLGLFPRMVKACTRLNAVTTQQTVFNGNGKPHQRCILRRGRSAVGNRIDKISLSILKSKEQ